MTSKQLKELIKSKSIAFEHSLETNVPHAELVKDYKELKELQYQLVLAEISERGTEFV